MRTRALVLLVLPLLVLAGCGGDPPPAKPQVTAAGQTKQAMAAFNGGTPATDVPGRLLQLAKANRDASLPGQRARFEDYECAQRCRVVVTGTWARMPDGGSAMTRLDMRPDPNSGLVSPEYLYRAATLVWERQQSREKGTTCWTPLNPAVTVPPTSTELPPFFLRSPRFPVYRDLNALVPLAPGSYTINETPAGPVLRRERYQTGPGQPLLTDLYRFDGEGRIVEMLQLQAAAESTNPADLGVILRKTKFEYLPAAPEFLPCPVTG